MTPDTPDATAHDDTGEPVAELRDLSLAVDPRFGRRVRGRIERRILAGEALGFAWAAPMLVLLELVRVPLELFSRKSRP